MLSSRPNEQIIILGGEPLLTLDDCLSLGAYLTLMPGKVAVLMFDRPELMFGIYLPDMVSYYYSPDVGQVVGVGLGVDLLIGDVVMVGYGCGKLVKDFTVPDVCNLTAVVRFIGYSGGHLVCDANMGEQYLAQNVPWDEHVVGVYRSDMESFVATGRNVVIKISDLQTTSSGGVLLPKSEVSCPLTCSVVGIGPDVKEVGVGSKVIFHEGACRFWSDDGQVYATLLEESIYAVVSP